MKIDTDTLKKQVILHLPYTTPERTLPHPTVQKFAVITVAVVGASRRFLSQITRHQNEVKFMSASLQYSNYAGQADFAIPYEIITAPAAVRELYLKSCHEGMDCYEKLCAEGIGHRCCPERKPKAFEELLKKLEAAGIEVNQERKHLRFRLSPEDRYTRCDTLKGDYTEQAIKERIAGTRTAKPRRTSPQKPVSKVGLLVDIEAAIRSGKGPGYERWAKVFNLKQLSQAVIWLKEHGDISYEALQEKSDAATASFNALSVQIKELESQMAANGELQKQIVNYAKTRAVYMEYRKAFSSYKQARADMKELHNVRANVEHLLDIPTGREPQKSRQ